MTKVPAKLEETQSESQKPTIVLTLGEDGNWHIEANVKNPKRIIRTLGARLVLEQDE